QSTINNLSIYDENLSAANSRIRDADIAEESSELVKQQILQQAGVAVLGHANSSQQQALKLLG
ncbi:flagellin, partial [Klebsiella pneumoniae]|uniref:flagellin n=1 Tax=Klebsiella pneumoniae TaxID=573 RepID=UPI003EE11D1B